MIDNKFFLNQNKSIHKQNEFQSLWISPRPQGIVVINKIFLTLGLDKCVDQGWIMLYFKIITWRRQFQLLKYIVKNKNILSSLFIYLQKTYSQKRPSEGKKLVDTLSFFTNIMFLPQNTYQLRLPKRRLIGLLNSLIMPQ